MKNSGIEWIGEIPDDWQIKTVKQLLIERTEKNYFQQTSTILSLSAKEGVTLYDGENHSGNRPREDLSDYKVVYPNDLVINSMNILSGAVGLSDFKGCISPVYYILFPRENDHIRFLYYIFQCKQFQLSLRGLGNGILIKETETGSLNTIRTRIPIQKLNMQGLPCCSYDKQLLIAEYLDKKCAMVERLIENQRGQIEKLKEYKQSVITEAVTKGLDPTVPMKHSGVDWIGDLPADWKVTRIKYVCMFNPAINQHFNQDELVGYVPMECVKNGYMESREISIKEVSSGLTNFENGDIIMAKVTPCFENGNIAIAQNLKNGIGYGSSELFVFRTTNIDTKFLLYFLRNDIFMEYAKATMTGTGGLKRVSPNFIKSLRFAYPCAEKQQEIAEYLDKKCAEIDRLIAIKQQKIEKLNDYKKSLIYEYVTGKKQVS